MRAAWIDRCSSCEAGLVVSIQTVPPEDRRFEPLPWDSERFGFPVARVGASVSPEVLSAVVDEMRHRQRRGPSLLRHGSRMWAREYPTTTRGRDLALVSSTRASSFLRILKSRVARGATGDRTAAGHPADENRLAKLDIRSIREQEVGPALIELARGAGRYSRFRVDPRIPAGVFHAIYDAWLIRSVRREIADEVFVGSVGGEDVGLVTVAAETDATIGLLSIGDSMRGRGFGRAMTEHAFGWAADRGCRVLRVTTQLANAAACALYASVGCSVESRGTHILHIWLA